MLPIFFLTGRDPRSGIRDPKRLPSSSWLLRDSQFEVGVSPGFRDSEIQGFRGFRIEGFKDQGFKDQGFAISDE
jgi:hypothetical protein